MSIRRAGFVVLAVFVSLLFTTDARALDRSAPATRAGRARSVRHRRVVWRPMFRGSRAMLVRQNAEIDRLELPRIEDEDELLEMEENQELVPVRESRYLTIAENLSPSRRYCRPWTRDFLDDFAKAYYEEFGEPIRVNSLVRTVQQQKKLRRHNRNAAPIDGETASTHLTGITVDIARRGMTRQQLRWIERYFLPLQEQGIIEPVEERRQAVFHVVVYGAYSERREASKVAGQ